MNMTGTASFGSLTAAQQQDVRTTEIPHQMECVERTLKGCEQGLETLEAKLLGSVLRQQPPTAGESKAGANGPVAIPQTPLGESLREIVIDLARLNDRIQSINARLEV